MDSLTIRCFRSEDRDALVRLWTQCGLIATQNHPLRDIERKLEWDPEGILVGIVEGALVASCFFGYEGHRGWINYLAVDADYQRQGVATRLVEQAEARLRALGCPKINLQVRSSNEGVIEFYRKLGYAVDSVVSLGKRLEVDEPWTGC